MEWIMAHSAELIGIFTGIVTVASIAAKMTPTEVDNKIVGFLLKLIDILAINTKPAKVR